jgi:hypothetical protein
MLFWTRTSGAARTVRRGATRQWRPDTTPFSTISRVPVETAIARVERRAADAASDAHLLDGPAVRHLARLFEVPTHDRVSRFASASNDRPPHAASASQGFGVVGRIARHP